MGLFDRKGPGPTPPPAAPNANKYSVQNVQTLLNEIGLLRLGVNDAQMKLFVTSVAWNTMKYINRKSNGGQPSGGLVAEVQEQLGMLKNVVNTYIDIQNNPDSYTARGSIPDLLEQGVQSLRQFSEKLEDTSSSGNSSDITGYIVDTKILSTHFN
jgi:hypothetical protein